MIYCQPIFVTSQQIENIQLNKFTYLHLQICKSQCMRFCKMVCVNKSMAMINDSALAVKYCNKMMLGLRECKRNVRLQMAPCVCDNSIHYSSLSWKFDFLKWSDVESNGGVGVAFVKYVGSGSNHRSVSPSWATYSRSLETTHKF